MDQEKTAESIEYACTQTINNKSKNNNAKVPVIQKTICQQKKACYYHFIQRDCCCHKANRLPQLKTSKSQPNQGNNDTDTANSCEICPLDKEL